MGDFIPVHEPLRSPSSPAPLPACDSGQCPCWSRPFFLGLHAQPALKKMGLYANERYPNTDFAYRYGFYLPSGATLTEEKIMRITAAVRLELGQ